MKKEKNQNIHAQLGDGIQAQDAKARTHGNQALAIPGGFNERLVFHNATIGLDEIPSVPIVRLHLHELLYVSIVAVAA